MRKYNDSSTWNFQLTMRIKSNDFSRILEKFRLSMYWYEGNKTMSFRSLSNVSFFNSPRNNSKSFQFLWHEVLFYFPRQGSICSACNKHRNQIMCLSKINFHLIENAIHQLFNINLNRSKIYCISALRFF